MTPTESNSSTPPFASLLTICCLVTFGCYFAISTRLPIVPLLAKGFGVTTAQIGVINSAYFLMAGIFSLPSGLLSDLFGRRRLALIGLTVLCLGMSLLYFSRSFFQLTVLYLLLGCGTAAFGPTIMAWVAAITPASHLGRAYGWYTTALFGGLGLGPAAAGVLGQSIGLKPVFLLAAALLVPIFWGVVRYLPPQPVSASKRQNTVHWRTHMRTIGRNRPLIGCWLATYGANVVAGMFFTFLPLHAADKGLGVRAIGAVFLVQALVNALSRIPIGNLTDRVSERKHLALAGVLLVSISIATFAPATKLPHFLLAGLALGVSNAIAFTSIGALIAETSAPETRGLAMGGYNSCIYLGLMSGAIVLGPVIEQIGFAAGFVVAGLLDLPFIVLFAFCLRAYSGRK